MKQTHDEGMKAPLAAFLGGLGDLLENARRRAGSAAYAMGLMSNSERKSAEPIAALRYADPGQLDAAHQRLHHFVGQAAWEDAPVRAFAARYALEEIPGLLLLSDPSGPYRLRWAA
jgi:SRSO17 transposase